MTSCISFAKTARCEIIGEALRLLTSHLSGRFVVAQQSVYLTLGSLRQPQVVFYTLSNFWLEGLTVPRPGAGNAIRQACSSKILSSESQ